MTVPSYTEDLTDITTAETITGWDEFTGNSYNGQGADAADAAYQFIQGTVAITQICTKSATVGSEGFDFGGTTGGHGIDGAYFVWQTYGTNGNLGTYAQGGFRIVVGTSLAVFSAWYVGGVDKSPYPYGGWSCNVANTTITPDDTAGTLTVEQFIGGAVYVVTGSNKGSPHGVDAIRMGRGSSIFEFGEVSDYCNIAGFAALNDLNINPDYNRWGLLSETGGGYLWQGRMSLGTVTNPVDFRDNNRTIFIKWTPKVTANFNLIEILNTDSNVEMTGFTFQVLDITTASKGRWLTTDNAVVALDGCTFIDMDSFVFDSNTTVDGCIFRRCGLVTQADAVFDGCLFDEPSGPVGFEVTNLDDVDDCIFNSDGTGYAMELDPSMAGNSYTMSGCSFVDYAATDGSTGNEAIYNNTGGTVTISVGAGQIPTVHDDGTSVTIITASVPVYIIVKDEDGNPIQDVQTAVFRTSDRLDIINQDTDIDGEVDTSYAGSTPEDVEVRCRKSSSGATKYKNYSSLQTIATTTGLSLAVTMIVDPNNNATS
jgi:hypothetical protein